MPRLIFTEGAAKGLDRCRHFLASTNPEAGRRAAEVISRAFGLLEKSPFMGHPLADMPDLRDLAIGFGKSGYVAFSRYDETTETILSLAFRHQREAGY